MTSHFAAVTHLSDEVLIEEVKGAAGREREATARLIALVTELDARRLYLGQGCSSLFSYCTQVLRLSEHAAYGRIEAARAGRKFPIVLDLLADGAVTLTTITLLAPHLTPANYSEVLEQARHQSKREVEHIVARLRPLPDVPAIIRKVPARPAAADALSTPSAAPAGQTSEPVSSLLGDEESPLPRVPQSSPTAAAPSGVRRSRPWPMNPSSCAQDAQPFLPATRKFRRWVRARSRSQCSAAPSKPATSGHAPIEYQGRR